MICRNEQCGFDGRILVIWAKCIKILVEGVKFCHTHFGWCYWKQLPPALELNALLWDIQSNGLLFEGK